MNARWHEPIRECAGESVPGNEFVFRPTTYKASFDCDRAATLVEEAICHDELIAVGDLEMTEAYRAPRASSSAEEGAALRSSPRAWLSHRDRACVGSDGAVDDICLARLYSDRLVELKRAGDPGLGAGPRFDATQVTALIDRGADLGQDAAVRLAMYPLDLVTSEWQADTSGVLIESTHTATHIVWPSDVEFRYSKMLFVGFDGVVWTARHIEPRLTVEHLQQLNPHQVWAEAGGCPLTLRFENGVESTEPPALEEDIPALVPSWPKRHPIAETMRRPP